MPVVAMAAAAGTEHGSRRMVTFTDRAREVVLSLVEQMGGVSLRIAVSGDSPVAPEYHLALVDSEERAESDEVVDAGGFEVLIDPRSAPRLRGLTVDWVQRNGESGFELRLPSLGTADGSRPSGPLFDRVLAVIRQRVNPGVASHGGEIGLVDVKDAVAYIVMRGGCQGCALSTMTLRSGVERMIKEEVPEIVEVRDVTDHQSGDNPFYT